MPQRMMMRRPMVATLSLLLAVPVFAACDGMDKALDCAKVATRIAGDVQDLQSAATNIGQLSEKSRRQDTSASLAKIEKDLREVGGNTVHVDVRRAVDDLSTALVHARDRARDGRGPDVAPLADAAGRLSIACTTG
ncbi:hypothetical protein QMK19_26825 [Streptomyces sp. H10-C2]|uniref:hypothetical protein n=1 Tax=unclassified Streptomyces TaxID=2593676 RepID=UPI0024B8CB11|nr:MULTISPECIES: hypothetical protein [unclassified Streptomyces]MDJ0343580.1 hypothetical protein [Streptomyces sp. PH10-H1]MDJ0373172.1 hypothetical protein [Streptomyces sp. H10-C2]